MHKELIRVLIVDDHAVVREGLKHVISRQLDMIVAGEASTRAEAMKLLGEQRFDVVVCDVKLPDGQGWDVLKAVKGGPHPLPVLMLSAFTEDQFAVQALKNLKQFVSVLHGETDAVVAHENFSVTVRLRRSDFDHRFLARPRRR